MVNKFIDVASYQPDTLAYFKAAKKLNVGGVMINDASRYRVAQMPFGGIKGSGVGREGLPYAIELLSDLKNVVFTSNNL